MKVSYLPVLLFLFIGFSCTTKQGKPADETKLEPNTGVSARITLLSALPDSLQPKTIFLDEMPAPKVVSISQDGNTRKRLPVLIDKNGDPILDEKGDPFSMGDGGKSNFTNFTSDDGVPLDVISSVFIDKLGNLWFGTRGAGISRYDGKSFTNFTSAQGLANNIVLGITEDKKGNLWFATSAGASRYDGVSFTNFTTDQGLADNFVWDIIEDKNGNLWFGTNGGVSRLDPSDSIKTGTSSFKNFTTAQGLAHDAVLSIEEDIKGNIWFGTNGGGISRLNVSDSGPTDTPTFSNFTTEQGLSHHVVYSIAEEKSGVLWFGTDGGGVSRFDGNAFETFTTAQGLAQNEVWSIHVDKTGVIWFGTRGSGITRYDPADTLSSQQFSTFTTAQGLSNNDISSITEDKAGNLWIGTYGEGLSRYDGPSFSNFTTAHGLTHNLVWSINEDRNGNFWFTTRGGGVSRFDGSSFTNYTTAQGLANNLAWCVTEDKSGNLWFGTAEGVSRYDKSTQQRTGAESFTNFTTAQGLAHNLVWCITEDRTGNLWFGTRGGGVSRFDGKSFSTFTIDQGLANNEVLSILEDKSGNLWFGTSAGVSFFDGRSFSTLTTDHGLSHNQVWDITEDQAGNIWFGTAEGLSVLDKDQIKGLGANPDGNLNEGSVQTSEKKVNEREPISPPRIRSYRIADGLPDNFVTQVIQLPDGKMAVGTNFGITLFDTSLDFSKLTNIEIFNSYTGYPVKDVNVGQNCMFLDSKGKIWAGTGSEKTALVRFDPSALHRNLDPPTLVIQSIKVKDEAISWYNLLSKNQVQTHLDSATASLQEFIAYGKGMSQSQNDSILKRFGTIQFDGISRFYPIPQNLVLPYKHNQVSFEFAAIETTRPLLVNYQYLLEGYSENWSPVTSRSNVSFGNITEGTYTFKLKAQGANGVWTEPIVYTFQVLPPWWRTSWAYFSYLALLGLLAFEVNRRQRKRLIQKERERADEQRKEFELQKAAELKVAFSELAEAHSNLKATQTQLIHAEKMASLGELTAGIAHEIQNPLNFVNNFSELNKELIDEIEEERAKNQKDRDESLVSELFDDIKQNLEKISHHGRRAGAIVKGMLAHSRTSTGEKVPTDINALVEEFLGLSFHGLKAKDKNFNADFITDFDPSLPKAPIAPQDMGRVILNLINNAFQACTNAEYLSQNPGVAPLVKVSTKNMGDKIEIAVSDNGPGIPEAIRSKIFQPFFTTKPTGQGTGLGLSLSFDIVKVHGGELKVESKEGEGTCFSILLPIHS